MKIVYQRVSEAKVWIKGQILSGIGEGALLFLAIEKGDSAAEIVWGARKCAELRIFDDSERKMNKSLLEVGGAALVVSQFTLAGRVNKGRRPSFDRAAEPIVAEELYNFFCEELGRLGVEVKRGEFGAMMDVELVNSGPVTFIVNT